MKKWGVEDAAELYGINKWGADYFTISKEGDVVVTPFGRDNGPGISLYNHCQGGGGSWGCPCPFLLRVENILEFPDQASA